MIIDELNALEEKGLLKKWAQLGIVPIKYITYREIYLKYNYYVTQGGMKPTDAVVLMSERFGVSNQTIWTARKVMARDI